MINRWSFIIKKTLYYKDLDTEDVILRPVNSNDDDDDDDDDDDAVAESDWCHLWALSN